MKKSRKITVQLSLTDLSAISSALPLLLSYQANTLAQQTLNTSLCATVADKVSRGDLAFTPSELRIIACSVYAAQQFLAGHLSEEFDDLTPEELSDLRRHLFTYNRLVPLFSHYLVTD